MIEPVEISDIELAFPANALDWMPPPSEIPHEYWKDDCWQHDLWHDVLYYGVEADIQLYPVEGVDAEKAWRQLMGIKGSFAPKHQHKMAALAYLTSQWFLGAKWRRLGTDRIMRGGAQLEENDATPES